MNKLLTISAAVIGAATAGILAWRAVEAQQLENDLWAEAERITDEQDSPSSH